MTKQYLISEELLEELIDHAMMASAEKMRQKEHRDGIVKNAKDILDGGPVPEPPDMSDEAMNQSYQKHCCYSGFASKGAWNQCWQYLRGDK
jgi:hypothetical protein